MNSGATRSTAVASRTERSVSGLGRAAFPAFALISLLALIRLLRQPIPGHYRVFTGAGRALWAGQNPYGTDFGTGVGYYFYSPTAAMTVFGPLSALPEKLGLVVFMLASWTVFVLGARAFRRAFGGGSGLALFWIAISPQIFGGILASKLEILMTGMLLLAVSWLREGRNALGAAALFALTLNWKFQPLPLVGLVCLGWLILHRDSARHAGGAVIRPVSRWQMPAVLAALLAALYVLPFAVFPRELLLQAHQTWRETFSHFVGIAFLDFENVFTFAHNAFGVPVSFAASQAVSAIAGAGLAAFLGVWAWRRRQEGDALAGALLLATAFGSAYMTSFSPLGQNNAMTLYAPLLLCGFVVREQAPARAKWNWILAATFVWMTLLYSDAVPVGLRNELRHLSLKPLACLGLAGAIAGAMPTPSRPAPRSPSR